MKRIQKRKCRHCKKLFIPNCRNKNRQFYCSRPSCRKASKAASQKKWLDKPENQGYFKCPENTKRVQEWRKKNPGYSKRFKSQTALQEPLKTQNTENKENKHQIDAGALQDLLLSQHPVIIGLISNFIGSSLQDDIANTLLAMQQSGQDILCPQPQRQGEENDCKRADFQTAYP